MELRQLRYFTAVAEELHFGRAAARLHLAPPSLSQQIRVLERSVGAELFERSPRAVTLTAAGEALLTRAQALLADADSTLAEVQAVAAGNRGHLRIGLFTSNAGELTLPILRQFHTLYPGVSLSFQEVGFAGQINALTRHEVDVAFVRPPFISDDIDVRTLASEDRMALVPTSSSLADAPELRLDDLDQLPFIEGDALPMPGDWTDFWILRESRGGKDAYTRPARQPLASYAEVVMEVAMNGTMTTVPASMKALTHNPGVTLVPVRGLECDVAVAVRSGATGNLAHDFVQVAVDVAERSQREAAPSVQ